MEQKSEPGKPRIIRPEVDAPQEFEDGQYSEKGKHKHTIAELHDRITALEQKLGTSEPQKAVFKEAKEPSKWTGKKILFILALIIIVAFVLINAYRILILGYTL